MMEGTLTLLQFPYSPYNEKARWALDYKRVAHRRRSFLPGPHKLKIRRLTGQSGLPVGIQGPRKGRSRPGLLYPQRP